MASLLLGDLAISVAVFLVVWLVSVAMRDASIVDIVWGPSLALMGIVAWIRADVADPRGTLLMALVTLWGARLGIHLAARNLGHGEDFRYVRMRQRAGSDRRMAIWSLPMVFGVQCLVGFFVSLPVQVGQVGGRDILGSDGGSLGLLAIVGIAVYATGFFFEAVGDFQLRAFKKDPANTGKLMDRGLWSWTRHPNYFGDAAVWFGLTLIALESEWGWTTILSPVLMLYFLAVRSGKGLLERSMRRRYPEFDEYAARVSGFFPRPPKRA